MFKLLRNSTSVLRLADGATIPDDERNIDRQKYQLWIGEGNAPEPADPEPPPTQDELDAEAAKRDTAIAALAGLTNAQVRTYINNSFPSLTAAERDKLGALAVIVKNMVRRI